SSGVEGSGPGVLADARRSVLDVVMEDTVTLQGRLGAADRMRLEAHLDGLRDLEGTLDHVLSCEAPGMPAEIEDDPGTEQLEQRNLVMARLLAMALACDLTRVFTY